VSKLLPIEMVDIKLESLRESTDLGDDEPNAMIPINHLAKEINKDINRRLDKTKKSLELSHLLNNFTQGMSDINDLIEGDFFENTDHLDSLDSEAVSAALSFFSKFLNGIDDSSLQNILVQSIEVRESMHSVYVKIEDALDSSDCINRVGDLHTSLQIQANRLASAAKLAKKQRRRFDPSLLLPGYELYNRSKHGDPIAYLQHWFGRFLKKCNKDQDYLWRGDIACIDPALKGAGNRDNQIKYEELVAVAGKKSIRQVKQMTARGRKKFKKINALDASYRP
jgi:hypothetical protein